jgi:F-type H+-transporting ATPase subunit delta
MSDQTIAERWARAIFELGTETGQLRELVDQVQAAGAAYAASPELRSVLDNPLIDAPRRGAVLAEVASRLGVGPLANNTLRLLAARRRLRALPEIARQLSALSDEKAGLVRATVSSAAPLDEGYYQKLTAELERSTGKKIIVERRTDPSLLGGVVTRLGDHTIDGSLRGRLEELGRRLAAG